MFLYPWRSKAAKKNSGFSWLLLYLTSLIFFSIFFDFTYSFGRNSFRLQTGKRFNEWMIYMYFVNLNIHSSVHTLIIFNLWFCSYSINLYFESSKSLNWTWICIAASCQRRKANKQLSNKEDDSQLNICHVTTDAMLYLLNNTLNLVKFTALFLVIFFKINFIKNFYGLAGLQISAGHRTFVWQIWGFYRRMLSLTGHVDWALQLWR